MVLTDFTTEELHLLEKEVTNKLDDMNYEESMSNLDLLVVRGKMILPSHGKEFFTSHGKHFFTCHGKQFFTWVGNDYFTWHGKQNFTLNVRYSCM